MSAETTPPPAKKAKKTKKASTSAAPPTLPDEFDFLCRETYHKFMKFRGESEQTEGDNDIMVAYAVVMGKDKPDFELTGLTSAQLCLLCKNVGIKYVKQKTKFQCRKALEINWQEIL